MVEDQTWARALLARIKDAGNASQYAKLTGTPRRTVYYQQERALALLKDSLADVPKQTLISVDDLPDPDLPVEQIIAHMKNVTSKQIAAHRARQLINIRVALDGPIGIAHFGDPHVDNPGTDWTLLEKHVEIVRKTEGMFGGNVGDTHDNWAGRLAQLYAHTPVTKSQTRKLIEWFCTEVPWMYFLLGNHDIWTGGQDIVEFMKNSTGAFEEWGARMNLVFPNGKEVRINARHDFKGSSVFNPVHGPMRAAVQQGCRDHILAAGHLHTSGYGILKDPQSGLISHAIRLAGYKVADSYAVQNGFPDGHISPNFLTIINPIYADDDPRLIRVELSLEEGAEVLKWMRKRYATGKSAQVQGDVKVQRKVRSAA